MCVYGRVVTGECVCVGVAFVVSSLLSGRERKGRSNKAETEFRRDEMDTLAVN